MSQTHFRACNLCEAMCGLAIEHEQGKILGIRGDREDAFSRGHLCPKALALKDVYEDPDRLRHPVRREGDRFVEVSWDEAFSDIGKRLRAIRKQHGKDAVAFSQGNPVLHNYGASIYAQTFLPWALGTRNRFSSTSVDNLPRMLVSKWMYGNQAILPVPDVDRTAHLLILGANPMASNGSVMTAPDLPNRLKALRARGGRLIVLDPRRTETAAIADAHHFIRPGSDAFFLLGFLHTLFTEGLTRLGPLPVEGLEAVRALALEFPPSKVAEHTGISAEDTQRLAREFAAAPSAVCYGRMGVSVQEFGLLATWLIDVVNVVTGNLDRIGGPMFTSPAVDLVAIARRTGQPGSFGSFKSRVRGLPEFNGELPIATMAEELEGQARALLITAHNPVLTAPNGPRLEKVLQRLELMVAVDLYVNETTRHAHYILPSTTTLEHDHYDIALHAVAIRNTARWNAPLFEPPPGALHDWQIYLRLIAELQGGLAGRALLALGERLPPRAVVELLLRAGPTKLTVKKLEDSPHGVDLGPLVPRLAQLTKVIQLAPKQVLDDVARLRRSKSSSGMVLIGRRDLRSNNSWLHNSERLVKGRSRCTLSVHPDDAGPRGLETGDVAQLQSRSGSIDVPVEVTDAVMPGVVSLPHGWGHGRPGVRLSVASQHAGVSVNDVTDEQFIDESCGTAVLNGVPISLSLRSGLMK